MFIITQIKLGCYGKKQITHAHARAPLQINTKTVYTAKIQLNTWGLFPVHFHCPFFPTFFQHRRS